MQNFIGIYTEVVVVDNSAWSKEVDWDPDSAIPAAMSRSGPVFKMHIKHQLSRLYLHPILQQ